MKTFNAISLTLIMLFTIAVNGLAQNLVPNPSFEDTVACPWSYDKINYATGWFKPSTATSDLLHSCSFQVPQNFFGYQNSNIGNAYAGLYSYHTFGGIDSNYREYISIKLTDSLMQGEKYNVEYYTSRSDSSNYATILGIFFSSDSIYSGSSNNLNFIPQLEETFAVIDKNQWVKLSYLYVASGGEKYINIGNFRHKNLSDTLNTADGGDVNNPDYYAAYYFIDDVSVVKDTTTGINDFFSHKKVKIYPNPTTGIINIALNTKDVIKYKLVNILSQKITIPIKISNNKVDISNNSYGIYLLYIEFENQTLIKKIILTP